MEAGSGYFFFKVSSPKLVSRAAAALRPLSSSFKELILGGVRRLGPAELLELFTFTLKLVGLAC